MKLFFYLKAFLILAAVILFSVGCSSSNTVRYGSNSDNSNDNINTEDDSLAVDLNLDLSDPSDLPAYEPDIKLSDVIGRYSENKNPDVLSSDNGTTKEKVLMEIIKYLNTPYKYGGNSKDGIDCSAFTQTIYKNTLSFNLERSARLQYKQGKEISDTEDLRFGDLVFFNTRQRVRPGHVGIYIGDNLFAHASSKKGVTISSLDHSYYIKRYMGGRRMEMKEIVQ
ncbi:MAG: C40 family peptidase [Ignavibacteriaceae bacterium]|nr:C40 family peptidase [Ignavibacteriaceae bacterium]